MDTSRCYPMETCAKTNRYPKANESVTVLLLESIVRIWRQLNSTSDQCQALSVSRSCDWSLTRHKYQPALVSCSALSRTKLLPWDSVHDVLMANHG